MYFEKQKQTDPNALYVFPFSHASAAIDVYLINFYRFWQKAQHSFFRSKYILKPRSDRFSSYIYV